MRMRAPRQNNALSSRIGFYINKAFSSLTSNHAQNPEKPKINKIMTKFAKSTRGSNCRNWKQTSFASQYRYDIAGSRARRFQSAYLKLIGGTIFLTFVGVLFFVQIQSRFHPQEQPVSKYPMSKYSVKNSSKRSQNLHSTQFGDGNHQIACDTHIKIDSTIENISQRIGREQPTGFDDHLNGGRTFGKMRKLVKNFFQVPTSFKQYQYRRHRRHAEMLLAHIKLI